MIAIPAEIIRKLEAETTGLIHGEANLRIIFHDGHIRYVIAREQSIVPGKSMSGSEQRGPNND
ncbi:hypothetical protein AGMMS49942_03550 [Spirochaetia bacterium]|nr:hypothetical protein AGMMS49942_03550 [Spirochaetia bacterium]